METRFSIIIDILVTHYVDSIVINGRIIALDRHNTGFDCVDITNWTFKQIKYDLLNY